MGENLGAVQGPPWGLSASRFYFWKSLTGICAGFKIGKDYSGTKFFYTEPLFLNKAHPTKWKAFNNKTLYLYNHSLQNFVFYFNDSRVLCSCELCRGYSTLFKALNVFFVFIPWEGLIGNRFQAMVSMWALALIVWTLLVGRNEWIDRTDSLRHVISLPIVPFRLVTQGRQQAVVHVMYCRWR